MFSSSDASDGSLTSSLSPDLLDTLQRQLHPSKKRPIGDVKSAKKALEASFEGRIVENEPMSRHSAIKIGGPADLYCTPTTLDALRFVCDTALSSHVPLHIHGAGSNTLIKDGGIRGLVVSLAELPAAITILNEDPTSCELDVDAGVALHALVRFTGKHGLSGMEHLAGIPASVGGALTMNAGVPQGTILDHLTTLTVFLPQGGEKCIPKEKLRFSYRKTELPSGAVVISARFRLTRGTPETVQAAIAETLDRRKAKQPLHLPNLGSVFMNPSEDEVRVAWGKKTRLAELPKAGQLIEEAGLKGVRVGGARISDKHANFIVNEGKASAEDVLILIRLAKDKVKETSGILLKPEIKVIGED
jgi:UDP-N-acetylmuramate dehydrogenase